MTPPHQSSVKQTPDPPKFCACGRRLTGEQGESNAACAACVALHIRYGSGW